MRWHGWLAAIVGVQVFNQEPEVIVRRPVQSDVDSAFNILAREVSQSEIQCVAEGIL
jgi:hypothetical protein